MGGRYSQKELAMTIPRQNDDGATPRALDTNAALEAATAVTANPGDVARVAEWFAQVVAPGVIARVRYDDSGAMSLSWVHVADLADLDDEAVA